MNEQVVYKYPLNPMQTRQTITLPVGAQILSVQLQNLGMMLWALVDPESKKTEERSICIYGTGHAIYHDVRHISTLLINDGTLVLHVFEG